MASTVLLLALIEEPLELLQFVRGDRLVLEHVEHEQAGRPVEQPGEQMAERAAARLLLIDNWTVDESAPGLAVRDVALLLEDSQQRLDGAVVDRPLRLECGDDVGDCGELRSQSTVISRASPSVSVGERLRAMAA